MAAGIDTRHRKTCQEPREDGKCCGASFQAYVYDKRAGKLIRKTFPTKTAAKTWRQDALVALRKGTLLAPSASTVGAALDALIAGMDDGSILDRSGSLYKPATVRSYRQAAETYLKPLVGSYRLSELRRRDVQALVETLRREGLAASTIHNKLDPLRVVYRRAIHRDEVALDPTTGLELPARRGRRDRIATRDEAQALIAALPASERALWATAFYGGLRRGELRALRWSDVDLAGEPGTIRVRRTWDDVEGDVEPKTEAGTRTVPLTGALRVLIVEHGLMTRRAGDDLVFGRTPALPFIPSTIRARAIKAWRTADLEPLTPHEARHCCASYLIEAGLNDLELTATIGHTDPRTTKTIYGHLFPDSSATIAAKMDAYLDARAKVARKSNPEPTG